MLPRFYAIMQITSAFGGADSRGQLTQPANGSEKTAQNEKCSAKKLWPCVDKQNDYYG